MGTKMRWDQIEQERKFHSRSWRDQPSTPAQLDYIRTLARQRNYSYKEPKTKQGASDLIERLLAIPPTVFPKQEPRPQIELVQTITASTLRDAFTAISPQQAKNLVFVLAEADPGYGLFINELVLGDGEEEGDPISLLRHHLREVRTDPVAALLTAFVKWRLGEDLHQFD